MEKVITKPKAKNTTTAIIILTDGKDESELLMTLDSVLAQEYQPDVYIAVEGGGNALPEDFIEAAASDGIACLDHGDKPRIQIMQHYFAKCAQDILQFVKSGDLLDPDCIKTCVDAYEAYLEQSEKRCSFVYMGGFFADDETHTVTDYVPLEDQTECPKIHHFLRKDITGTLTAILFDRETISRCFYGPTYGNVTSVYQLMLRSFHISEPVYIKNKLYTSKYKEGYTDIQYMDIWKEFKSRYYLYPSSGMNTAIRTLRHYASVHDIKAFIKMIPSFIFFTAAALISGTSETFGEKASEVKSVYGKVKKKTGLSKILGD